MLLVAHPDDNDGDAASCRSVLRALHHALRPDLREPIPPLPLARPGGAFGMELKPKAKPPSSPVRWQLGARDLTVG